MLSRVTPALVLVLVDFWLRYLVFSFLFFFLE